MNNNLYINGGNLEGKVYCNQCRAVTKPKLKGSGWITIILLLFYIIPGLIYMVWRRSGLGVCGNCNSSNVIPAKNAKIQSAEEYLDEAKKIRCPDCRELIRFDARKCKHCGSKIGLEDQEDLSPLLQGNQKDFYHREKK
jgi:DNA-directed RNA polymerase subunit RPC12/RpoP